MQEETEAKEDDYKEALAIGEKLGEGNPDVDRLMVPLVEGRVALKAMLAEQDQFVGQAAKFKKFNQEAGAIESHISSCKRLLPEFNQRPTEEELDDSIKRQSRLQTMIENHDKRVQSFLASASDLDPEQV